MRVCGCVCVWVCGVWVCARVRGYPPKTPQWAGSEVPDEKSGEKKSPARQSNYPLLLEAGCASDLRRGCTWGQEFALLPKLTQVPLLL